MIVARGFARGKSQTLVTGGYGLDWRLWRHNYGMPSKRRVEQDERDMLEVILAVMRVVECL